MTRGADLCLAWNWEYDEPFVSLLARACRASGITFMEVTQSNLDAVVATLSPEAPVFRVLFDRASDSDPRFLALLDHALLHGCPQINRHDRALTARNKASMHLEFITAGLHTPHTIIVPSCAEQPQLPPLNIEVLGEEFFVKPAHGGGGEGVIRHARTWEDVERARHSFPTDRYLVQEWIVPAWRDGRPAWFRVLYCLGTVYPCWWDPLTHVYEPVSDEEQCRHNLGGLRGVAHVIAWITTLDLFSTEIAQIDDGRLVVVDYVNDPVDLRLRSITPDGVPDELVGRMVSSLVDRVVSFVRP